MFEDAFGEPEELEAEQLLLLLGVARQPIRLAVFNACRSASLAELVVERVDAAIGMEESIEDETAKTFAGQFYRSLAEGNSLENAFDQAKAQAMIVNEGTGLIQRPWCWSRLPAERR